MYDQETLPVSARVEVRDPNCVVHTRDRTHWEGCYTSHLDCAQAEITRLQVALDALQQTWADNAPAVAYKWAVDRLQSALVQAENTQIVLRTAVANLHDEIRQHDGDRLVVALRECHQALQSCEALICPETHPDVSAQITAILAPCDVGACPTVALNSAPKALRIRQPSTCERCGHDEQLHHGHGIGGLLCGYMDADGPCLCRGSKS